MIEVPEVRMSKIAPISLLITTYHGEDHRCLQRALDSVRGQTLAPAEVVLVVDGPVDALQEAVITRVSSNGYMGAPVKVIKLARNDGLANALNVGLEYRSGSWVARMDSDDVSDRRRLEIQWTYLKEHPEIDVLASWHRECGEDGVPLGRVNKIPEKHDEIVKKLKWHNIISHPTIVFRREPAMQVGGYDSCIHNAGRLRALCAPGRERRTVCGVPDVSCGRHFDEQPTKTPGRNRLSYDLRMAGQAANVWMRIHFLPICCHHCSRANRLCAVAEQRQMVVVPLC
ncbi:MAG: glycosyltransferase [Terracidiphilus sp.]